MLLAFVAIIDPPPPQAKNVTTYGNDVGRASLGLFRQMEVLDGRLVGHVSVQGQRKSLQINTLITSSRY
jgi:hypothetical protein